MRLLKLIPWAVGIGLVLATLIGANKLIHAQATATGGVGTANPAPSVAAGDSLITHGTVAAEVEIGQYSGSPFMASGRIEKVFVKEGDEVKAGTPLYMFDDKAAKADVDRAEAQVKVAEKNKELAIHRWKVEHPVQMSNAEKNVEAAEQVRRTAKQALDAANDSYYKVARAKGTDKTPTQIDAELVLDERVLKSQVDLDSADLAIRRAKSELEFLRLSPLAEAFEIASATVASAKTELDKAKIALDECTVTAKTDGVVEQITTAPGRLVGPTNTTPLLYLVPKGNRIVRAEVQPDFAFKLKDRTGQTAIIQDDNYPTYTYEGIVRRVGSSFLPRRGGGGIDLLNAKPTLVLEVEIEVKDPSPPGKPPLRVGQPVRVSIQQ